VRAFVGGINRQGFDSKRVVDRILRPVYVAAHKRRSPDLRKGTARPQQPFGGWGGEAVVSDPAWPFDLTMSSPDARFFQLYSPPSGGIFVIEPVTHANAALNAAEEQWSALGMRVLEPGEEMALVTRFELS
jgi:aldose 1-epimerase